MGELLIIAGAVTGLFVAWLYWGQSPLPTAAQQRINQQIQHAFRAGRSVPDGAVALMRIPALGATWQYPVYQGTGSSQLGKGIAHYVGTAGPGQAGNFAVAGHRSSNTGFEPLADLPDNIRVGDQVFVDTPSTEYVYQVTGTRRTTPSDVTVLRQDQGRGADPRPGLITITTCTPRYGSTGRFIVFGTLVRTLKDTDR